MPTPTPNSSQNLNGLLLVNKPLGITSFDVIRRLRRSTGARKIGHAGTLDPLATGLMLILFGTACKQAMSLTKLDKRYEAQITLGANSTTGDAEGEKTPVSDTVPGAPEIMEALGKLTGDVSQVPPIYSAIKIGGQEAYKHARAGRSVQMPSRQVTIFSNVPTRYEYPILNLNIHVSSGTYVRTIAEDLGKILGTGAYLSGLVRTEVGKYRLDDAITLDDSQLDNVRTRLIELQYFEPTN